MKIVKPTKFGIDEAVSVLKHGGVIVYPTDTAYALGGIFNSQKVANKILKIKKRKDQKFTIIASSLSQVKKYFKLNSTQEKLGKQFWPGPLSIVVSKKFAVRVPDHKLAQALARQTGKPLIATSANLTGQTTLYDSQKIIKQFINAKNQPDLILDLGKLKKIKTSTVIEVEDEKVKILRSGAARITESK